MFFSGREHVSFCRVILLSGFVHWIPALVTERRRSTRRELLQTLHYEEIREAVKKR